MTTGRIEVECKLVAPQPIRPARVEAALRRLAAKTRRLPAVIVDDLYLDTAYWTIFRAGYACRLRRQRRGSRTATVFGLKQLVRPGDEGMARRVELESPVRSADAAPTSPPPGCVADILKPVLSAQILQPLFTVHNVRRPWEVESGSLRALVTADEVAFEDDAPPACEIELELLAGPADRLRKLADKLRDALGGSVADATESKFQRGLSSAALTPPAPPQTGPIEMASSDAAADVARRTIARHAARLAWNQPGALLGLDDEAVHQMRVSARRLRAALRVFGPSLGLGAGKSDGTLVDELRWLGERLGPVRDLDVYLASLPEYRRRLDAGRSKLIDAYSKFLSDRRQTARAEMVKALNSPRYRKLVAALDRLIVAPNSPRRSRAGTTPVGRFARDAIRDQLDKAIKLGDKLDADSPDPRLHELRIACKRLRYTCEFVGPACGPTIAAAVRKLVRLQDTLGRLQDAVVAIDLLDEFARAALARSAVQAEDLLALGELVGWLKSIRASARDEFFRLWKKFARKRSRRAIKTAADLAAAGLT